MKKRIFRPEKLICVVIFMLLVALLYVLKTPCVFEIITHVPCPACGMTRAYLSLLKWDIVGAFAYHSLFWTVPIIFIFFWFDGNVFKRGWVNYLIMIALCAMFIIRWIITGMF